MKTIEELVGEVKKNLPMANTAPKKQTEKKTLPKAVYPSRIEKSVTEQINKKLTLDMAKELAKAAEIAANIIGVKIVVSVNDEGANLILLHAMDDSYIASVRASQDKAYTAVALKMPTHIALEQSRGGGLDGLTNGNGILLLGGGYPLEKNGKIYGGIGVSGGTKEQDTLLAAVLSAYFNARFE